MNTFFIVANSIWLTAHLYVGWRLTSGTGLTSSQLMAFWVVFLLVMLLGPAVMMLNRLPEKAAWVPAMQWAGYVYMGAFLVLFPLVVAKDVVQLGTWAVQKAQGVASAKSGELPPDNGRREAIARAFNFGVLGLTGLITGAGLYAARKRPDVLAVNIPLKDLPADLDGFRIALLSDIHVGPTIKKDFIETITGLTNRLDADIVAITGDLVDGYVDELRDHVAPLSGLKSKHGVFYITGNHEYYWDPKGWIAEVERLGHTPLINEHRNLDIGTATLTIAGVTDISAHRMLPEHESDPVKALAGAPKDSFKLILAHQPKSAFDAAKAGAQLQLSGHTHGGQFIPWSWLIHLVQPVDAGLHTLAGMPIYVSRGTGYWGPPNRLGSPSEITLITLKKLS